MSGAKRSGKYRKSVTDEYINSYPEPEEDEAIARVRGSRGSNIFEIDILSEASDPTTKVELALLPNRFKNVIWVKRNDYLIVKKGQEQHDSISESAAGSTNTHAIQYEVQHVLNKDQIKHIKSLGKWPEATIAEDAMPPMGDYLSGQDAMGYGDLEEEEEADELPLKVDARGNTIFDEGGNPDDA